MSSPDRINCLMLHGKHFSGIILSTVLLLFSPSVYSRSDIYMKTGSLCHDNYSASTAYCPLEDAVISIHIKCILTQEQVQRPTRSVIHFPFTLWAPGDVKNSNTVQKTNVSEINFFNVFYPLINLEMRKKGKYFLNYR